MVNENGGELIGWRIGFIIGRILPTDHCGIVFDRTTVDVSGRDQTGWWNVIKRKRSLALCIGHCADQPNQKHHKKRQTASQYAKDMEKGEHIRKTSGGKAKCLCWRGMCCIMRLILLSLSCDNQVLTDIFVRATLKYPMWDMISIVAEQMVWPSSGVLAIRQCFWRPPMAFCDQSRIGL